MLTLVKFKAFLKHSQNSKTLKLKILQFLTQRKWMLMGQSTHLLLNNLTRSFFQKKFKVLYWKKTVKYLWNLKFDNHNLNRLIKLAKLTIQKKRKQQLIWTSKCQEIRMGVPKTCHLRLLKTGVQDLNLLQNTQTLKEF